MAEVVLVGTRGAAAIAREERENTHQLMNGTAGTHCKHNLDGFPLMRCNWYVVGRKMNGCYHN